MLIDQLVSDEGGVCSIPIGLSLSTWHVVLSIYSLTWAHGATWCAVPVGLAALYLPCLSCALTYPCCLMPCLATCMVGGFPWRLYCLALVHGVVLLSGTLGVTMVLHRGFGNYVYAPPCWRETIPPAPITLDEEPARSTAMNTETWKDNEIAYCAALVASGGDASVPRGSVQGYLDLQRNDASRSLAYGRLHGDRELIATAYAACEELDTLILTWANTNS